MGRRQKKKQEIHKGTGARFRSGYEATIAAQLDKEKVPFQYEKAIITYIEPATTRKYIPDFFLPNGIIVEAKGRWTLSDRKKIVLVIEQNPKLDVRMLFQRDHPINKGAKTRYSEWCEKRGIKYAIGQLPQEWLNEAKQK